MRPVKAQDAGAASAPGRLSQGAETDWTRRSGAYDRLQWVNDDRLLAEIVAAAGTPRTVLDLGTGTGKVLSALRQSLGEGEFWGVDLNRAMLDRIPEPDGLTLRCLDIEDLGSLPAGHFDLVTARMVFHHTGDIDRATDGVVRLLRPGGRFILCEGVPPTLRCIDWYTEMFRHKEQRRTFTEVDLIHLLARHGFSEITTRTIVVRDASLNNWLENSGLPAENIAKIKHLHYAAPNFVKQDYEMRLTADDCLMTWRFAVVCGRV